MPFQKPQLGSVKAKILLVGSFGSGKTYGGLTFPRPAVIDSEGSADLYARDKDGNGFDFVWCPTKSLKDALSEIQDVMKGKVLVDGKPCETLVLDSLSSFYDTVQYAMMRKDGAIDVQAWGLIKRQYAEFLDTLYHKVKTHVVATARVKPKFTGTDAKSGELLSDGEIIDCDKKVGYAFDLVFKLAVEKGKRTAKVMKTRGLFSTVFSEGQVIDGGFSWSLIEPVLAQYQSGPDRETGITTEESAAKDAAMMHASDRGTLLKTAGEACRDYIGATTHEEVLSCMAEEIAQHFALDAHPKRFADMTVEQLAWAAEHFTKLSEKGKS